MKRNWRAYNKDLFAPMRRASRDYGLIEAGDCIGIGLSGGKDSTLLLYSLAVLQKTLPTPFQIKAMSVDLGWENDYTAHRALCEELSIPFEVVPSNIGPIVFEERQEKNPCSLCARMRRGAVNNWAAANGCNKVALGHHLDDVIETLLMSLFFEGRLHTFAPRAYLSRADLTVIRPLVFVKEADIRRIVRKLDLPIMHNACPADGFTKRSEEKALIAQLAKDNPGIRDRMMHAVTSSLWTSYQITS
ncbi:tRNA 2-thiocytidine biosynthesis TtcA family protein [Peptococcus simiae]|uniref:tRNA 2-thiocytidine biosynthesis TtcA family protein n=1 Tax=Peptococcus simiae TaxID=1643805 RepID=A0ABW9GZ47_9FIRM